MGARNIFESVAGKVADTFKATFFKRRTNGEWLLANRIAAEQISEFRHLQADGYGPHCRILVQETYHGSNEWNILARVGYTEGEKARTLPSTYVLAEALPPKDVLNLMGIYGCGQHIRKIASLVQPNAAPNPLPFAA